MDCAILTVDEIKPHPNADRLEICRLRGYQAIYAKGQLKTGQKVLYICTDACIPLDQEWTKDIRDYVSPRTGRVRTVKLRGEWSEGIIVPLDDLGHPVHRCLERYVHQTTGSEADLAASLGIRHYEPPAPGGMGDTLMRYNALPYGLGKTNQENVQNMDRDKIFGKRYLVTRKKDGSSCTITFRKDKDGVDIHVTSRSVDLKTDGDNVFVKAATPVIDHVVMKITEPDVTMFDDRIIVLRGEVCGATIQKASYNKDAVGDPKFWCYEAFIMDGEGVLAKRERMIFDTEHQNLLLFPEVRTVPILGTVNLVNEEQIQAYLNAPASDGEGVVLWESSAPDGVLGLFHDEVPTGFSFKIRSKEYDSKVG